MRQTLNPGMAMQSVEVPQALNPGLAIQGVEVPQTLNPGLALQGVEVVANSPALQVALRRAAGSETDPQLRRDLAATSRLLPALAQLWPPTPAPHTVPAAAAAAPSAAPASAPA